MKYRSAYIIIFLLTVFYPLSAQEDLMLLQAGALIERGEPDRAIDIYTELIGDNNDYKYYLRRGYLYLTTGETENAANDFMAANSLSAGAGDYGLARVYAVNGMPGEAVDYLIRHLRSEYRKPLRDILLDPWLSDIEDTPQWRELWKSDWHTELETGIAEIIYFLDKGKEKEAENIFNDIRLLYSDRAETEYLEACFSLYRKDYRQASEAFGRIVSEGFSIEGIMEKYIEALEMSRLYLRAVSVCDEALKSEPENTGLVARKAELLLKANDFERALEEAELYLSLYPESQKAIRLAGTIASESGRYIKALDYFTRNIEKYPASPVSFSDRAGVYMKTDSWELAISDYSMSLDLQPRNGESYYMKGLANFNISRTDEACHDFRMALRYGYTEASKAISRNCIE